MDKVYAFVEDAVESDDIGRVAGELAAARSDGPGSFKMHLYDEVSNLSDEKAEPLMNFETL